ncbi:RIP metalloprotease RseP [Bacillus solimangrovi]|uniref:Zinc metalloprotease n=1 Tax=Bacillus solimangrovi TaxID=1305675 RepID=A0A1E5LE18_9BACI|nr:RIP metalloprotease RseP [Bacillus solimangrovi]OEH92323.1 RIP metalloprotease RseP [Bacillus solimangrovi]
MNQILAFIIIFGVLVFVHELGHLIFAKRSGMLAREFAIGFGPKVFSFKRDETVYTIRLLPLGGFVRVAGEDPELVEVKPGYHVGLLFNHSNKVEKIIINNKSKYPDAKIVEVEHADFVHDLVVTGYEENEETLQTYSVDERAMLVADEQETQIAPYHRQFVSKTIGQRAMQIFAGPLMNFALAFVIFVVIAMAQGIPTNEAKLGQLTDDGAARQAGLLENDQINSIDGEQVSSWEEIVKIVQQHPDEPIEVHYERNGEENATTVTPKAQVRGDVTVGIIGVYPSVEKSFFGSLKYGVVETATVTKEIFTGLGLLVTGQLSFDQLSGPVGIYEYTGKAVENGIYIAMQWTALLSINLGIFNLLPLPALDGGRLTFIAIEALRGKPLDPQKEGMVHFIGFAFLMLLMIVVTWNDIQTFFLK